MVAKRDEIEDPEETAAPVSTNDALVSILARLAENAESGPVKQIPRSKAKIRTPWHPSGSKNRPKLARQTYVNGGHQREILLSNKEIELFNQIKPGMYINRKVLVIESADKDGAAIAVYFPNKTQEDRLLSMQYAPNLETLLGKIVEEQSAVA